MTYSVKYYVIHKPKIPNVDVTFRIELLENGFAGTAVEKKGTGSVFDFGWDGADVKKIWDNPIQKGYLDLTLFVQGPSEVAILDDIVNGGDKQYQLRLKINGVAKWTGYVIPDLIEYSEGSFPFGATISAKDLHILESEDYETNPGIDYEVYAIELANVLNSTGLNLGIYSYNDWTASGISSTDDYFNQVSFDKYQLQNFSSFSQGFEPISKLDALKEMIPPGFVLRQYNNKWQLISPDYLAKSGGTVDRYEYDSAGVKTGKTTGITLTEDVDRVDSFILGDRSTNKPYPGVKKLEIKYNHKTSIQNILFDDQYLVGDDGAQFYGVETLKVSDTADRIVDILGSVVVDTDTNPGSFRTGTAYILIQVDDYELDLSTGSWGTNVGEQQVSVAGSTDILSGSFGRISAPIPNDVDESTLRIELRFADVSGETVQDVTWSDLSCQLTNGANVANGATYNYRLVQDGEYSTTGEVGEIIIGEGPNDKSNSALRYFTSGAYELLSGFQHVGGSPQDYAEFVLSNIMNLQRVNAKSIDAELWAFYDPVNILVYEGNNYVFLNGSINGYDSIWNGTFVQLNWNTGTDTFEQYFKVSDSDSGTVIPPSSGSGPSLGDLEDEFFQIDNALSEGNAAAIRTNIGTEIGSDVQAWDADLDTYAGNPLTAAELGQLQNIDDITISNTQWGYIGALDQDVSQNQTPQWDGVNIGGNWLFDSASEGGVERLRMQAVGANDAAELFIQAKGSANSARFALTPDSSPANFSALTMESNGTNHSIESTIDGTASLLPIKMRMGGSDAITVGTNLDTTVHSDLHVDGNIFQDGSTYETHVEQLYTEKDFIIQRDGAVGAIAADAIAGSKVLKADGTNNVVFGTDNSAIARVGWEGGTLQALATRPDSPDANGLAIWNDTQNWYETDSNLTYASGVLGVPQINTGQGATEVHLMDQNVRKQDDVEFGDGRFYQSHSFNWADNTLGWSDSSTSNIVAYNPSDSLFVSIYLRSDGGGSGNATGIIGLENKLSGRGDFIFGLRSSEHTSYINEKARITHTGDFEAVGRGRFQNGIDINGSPFVDASRNLTAGTGNFSGLLTAQAGIESKDRITFSKDDNGTNEIVLSVSPSNWTSQRFALLSDSGENHVRWYDYENGAEIIRFERNGNVGVSGLLTANAGLDTGDRIQSDHFATGSTGWQVNYAGAGEFDSLTSRGASDLQGLVTTHDDIIPHQNFTGNIGRSDRYYLTGRIAELYVPKLVVEEHLSTTGGVFYTGIGTVLSADIASTDTTIKVKNNNLSNGDYIRLYARSQYENMQVTSAYTDNGDGTYSYSVTRNIDGSGANAWKAGDGIFDTGATAGFGFIEQYATNSLTTGVSTSGPSVVYQVRTGTGANDIAARAATGNLKGWYGYSTDVYGAAFGDESAENITIDPTNGFRVRNNSNVAAQLSGTIFKVGDATNYLEFDVTTSALTGVFDNLDFDSDTYTLTSVGGMVIDSASGIDLSNGDFWHDDGNSRFANGNVLFNADASGSIASGNIAWNPAGDVTLDPSVTIGYEQVTNLEVGGTNYFTESTSITDDFRGSTTTTKDYSINGFEIVAGTTTDPEGNGIRINNVIWNNGYWTVSFYAKATTQDTINVDICDGGLTSFDITTSYQKFTLTHEVTNYGDGSTYEFIDITNIADNNTVTFKDVKVEQGVIATDWTPAPEETTNPDYITSTKITETEIESPRFIGNRAELNTILTVGGTTYGSTGIQLDYNAGTPRLFAGVNGGNFVRHDGTDFEFKATNTSLLGGTFTATDAVLTGKLTAGNVEVGQDITNVFDANNPTADGLYVASGTYIYGDEQFSFAGGVFSGDSTDVLLSTTGLTIDSSIPEIDIGGVHNFDGRSANNYLVSLANGVFTASNANGGEVGLAGFTADSNTMVTRFGTGDGSYVSMTSLSNSYAGGGSEFYSQGFQLWLDNDDLSVGGTKVATLGRLRAEDTLSNSTDRGFEIIGYYGAGDYRHLMRVGGGQARIAGSYFDATDMWGGDPSKSNASVRLDFANGRLYYDAMTQVIFSRTEIASLDNINPTSASTVTDEAWNFSATEETINCDILNATYVHRHGLNNIQVSGYRYFRILNNTDNQQATLEIRIKIDGTAVSKQTIASSTASSLTISRRSFAKEFDISGMGLTANESYEVTCEIITSMGSSSTSNPTLQTAIYEDLVILTTT